MSEHLEGTRLSDARLARSLALGTGEILKGVRSVGLLRGRTLGDAGDQLAQSWISRVLHEHRPEDGVLSEEAADNPARLSKQRVWIIDPLDGTKEFATGRQDWAVHIALAVDGTPVESAVNLPDLGVVFDSRSARAVRGPYARKIAVSQSRPPACATTAAENFGWELMPLGSAGAKAMHVLLSDADAYIHAGGQYEWDSAAPVGVARAAGLHCSRLDGSELTYNQEDTYLPDMLICRPEIADDMLAAVAGHLAEHGSYT